MNLYGSLLTLALMFLLSGCIAQSKPMPTPIALQGQTDISRALITQHQNWKGTPYLLGGSDRNGVDCSAFTKLTYRQLFRINIPRTTQGQAYYGETIHSSSLQAGDLVLFRTGGSKQRHVGIYVEDGVFLHASTSMGVMLSRLDNPYWQTHYWKAVRPNEMSRLHQQR
ncbi:MAG: C40 family peptidase [Neptuniibacter sp.]